jgi:hypothetical protein
MRKRKRKKVNTETRFHDARSFEHIGAVLGISRQMAQVLFNRAVRKVKRRCELLGVDIEVLRG